MRLLLISNSASPGETYLEKPAEDIGAFLEGAKEQVVLIPFAAVTYSFDEYVEKVNKALAPQGIRVTGIHTAKDPIRTICQASAVIVGGGNTFQLLKMMQESGILNAISERVKNGMPYVGWSAGSNVASPTICTTNDMPIVEPSSFKSFGFIPFQINPHYLDAHPSNHGGETREQRILEYIEANPDMYVVGLREGCRLFVEEGKLRMVGEKTLRIFRKGDTPYELQPNSDLQFLMKR